jgi:hypothetical protein
VPGNKDYVPLAIRVSQSAAEMDKSVACGVPQA